MKISDTIQKLIDSEETAYSISKNTNVDASIIQNLRLKKRKLENISLGNAEKLYEYAKMKGY